MKANDILPQLEELYLNKRPYDKYLLCFGISSLRTMTESGRKIVLRKKESLEEGCIVAYLKKRLPKRIIFRTEYD